MSDAIALHSVFTRIKDVDEQAIKLFKIRLLSTEGRILAVLAASDDIIVKDIPSLAGVSQRAAFSCLCKFSDLGIVSKMKSPEDGRNTRIIINKEELAKFLGSALNLN